MKNFLNNLSLAISISILISIFLSVNSANAFFKKDKGQNVCNLKEKYEYVNIDWWNKFNDPYLKDYVLKAIEYNHDLKKASWQVEEYRQFAKLSFNQELPTLSVSTSYNGINTPRFFGGKEIAKNIFAVPFIAQYEADFLLKNRTKTKAAKKNYEASKFEEKGIYISLVSDVTTTYINIMKFDKLIEIQTCLVAIKTEMLKRDTSKYSRGVITAQQLNERKKDLETACNDLNDLRKNREKTLNQLAVMIGEPVTNTGCLKRMSIERFEYCANVPCAIPSDIIFERPDVLAAETKIEKAKLDIKVAKKEFLPRFNITGIYAFNNAGSDNFFSWKEAFALLVASATQDIFKGGVKVTNLRIYKTRYEQLFENYKQTDLTALQEINDSLCFIKTDTNKDKATNRKFITQKDTYCRSNDKYKHGVISYLDLLSEKEMLLVMNQSIIDSKTTRLIDYITLYKAVGGKL